MSLELDKSAWKRVELGEVAASSKEKVDPYDGSVDRFVAGEHMDTDDLKIHRWGDPGEVDLGPAFHRRFRPGQVLYGSRRTYLRKVAVADFDGVCANTTFVVDTKDPRVLLQEFLPFVMTSDAFHAFAIAESKGSVNPYVNWSDIARYEFDLPTLEEQKRIADLLWTLERHRQKLVALAATLKLSASVLISDLRDSHPAVKYVREVATVRNGQNYPKHMQDGRPGDVPFFKVADLDRPGNDRYLTNPGGWVTSEDVAALSADILPPGTVVTARVGAAIRLERRRALASPALVDENHLVIRPHSIDADYLLAVLAETELARSSNGGVVPSLNQKIVGSVGFPDLSPESERRVGRTYRSLGDVRGSVLAEVASLVDFRSAVLSAVFGD